MSTNIVSTRGISALRLWTFTGALAMTLTFSAAARAENVQITASRLVVRKSPGAEEEKVGSAAKGRIYEVLERQGQWVKIRFGPKGGWVHAKYTQTTGRKASAEEPAGEADGAGRAGDGTHRVVPAKLNVRKAPGQKSPLAFHLVKGVKVSVTETQGEWSKITHKGRSGWAMTKFLTKGEAATAAPAPRRAAPRQPPPRRAAPAQPPPRRAAPSQPPPRRAAPAQPPPRQPAMTPARRPAMAPAAQE